MSTEKHIVSITWGFDDEKLFYSLDRNSRRCYDIPASAQNYARLCKKRLIQAYPNAKNIQIAYRINPNNQDELLPNLVETNVVYSFDGDDFDNYDTSDDIENVERICDKACNERWEKRKDWHSLTELSKRFKVPTALSRLACQTRLINDMWIDESVWKVFHKDFVDFAGKFKLHVNQELVAIKFDNGSCSLQDIMLAELAEIEYVHLQDVTYWVTKLEALNLPTIYDANNSIITLQFDHSQLLLTLHFFNTGNRLDGVDWTFDAFAKSLVSEASKHSEAEAIWQEYQ